MTSKKEREKDQQERKMRKKESHTDKKEKLEKKIRCHGWKAQPPTERPTRRARWWRHERYFFFENFSRPNFDFNFLSLQNFPKTAKTFKILNVSYPFHFLCIGGRMKTRYITLQGSELGPQSIALTTRPTSSPKTEPTKS